MTTHEIVKKLIGNIDPIGKTEVDEERLANLRATCDLVERLIADIAEVEYRNSKCYEYSRKAAAEYAKKFLDRMAEENSKWYVTKQ